MSVNGQFSPIDDCKNCPNKEIYIQWEKYLIKCKLVGWVDHDTICPMKRENNSIKDMWGFKNQFSPLKN